METKFVNTKTDTREKILNTAAFLFQKKGYHATGLNEIIKKSAAPKGCLYYYFPNGKEELAAAAIRFVGRDIQVEVEEILAKHSDPVKAIQGVIRQIEKFVLGKAQENRFSVSLLALETAGMSEILREACNQVFDLWTDMYYRKLISGGFSEKRAREVSVIIQSMVEGAITMSVTRNDASLLLIVAEQIPILLK